DDDIAAPKAWGIKTEDNPSGNRAAVMKVTTKTQLLEPKKGSSHYFSFHLCRGHRF
ncbi:hypothetical protein NDU88_005083, partial [Pleurodeles waltl]